MLDINIFRAEKGFDPERIRESQRRRFASVDVVDEIIHLDREWRQRQCELDGRRRDANRLTKEVKNLKIAGKDATEVISITEEAKRLIAAKELEVLQAKATLDSKLETIGNLIHDSVPVSNDEENNAVIHLEKGADVAGGRGFYLKGEGVLLNMALINYGLAFLRKRNYQPMQTPFFMRKDIMAKCAQLAQFDDELYKVTGEGDDNSSYTICWFCITSPNDDDSWEMHEEMLKNSEDFYKELNIPYQVVAIVSGALNDAAAKKYDLEGWFPASNTYRELVSCSNCTDYQSRRLGIGFGQKKNDDQAKHPVTEASTKTAKAKENAGPKAVK
ncbi:hypothetical protein OPV22_032436 [Ensete ventricosum]|uniref:Seryl-tRNA synthetase n=1 Tax=Ensete ventricosum TaxID=4639 RepID=A0AAV8PXC1_ENSVE|nr:hypothetical protein OPV22_032436 [Ensete ventricosum]